MIDDSDDVDPPLQLSWMRRSALESLRDCVAFVQEQDPSVSLASELAIAIRERVEARARQYRVANFPARARRLRVGPAGVTSHAVERLCAELKSGATVTAACASAGLSRFAYYRIRERLPRGCRPTRWAERKR